MGDKTMPTGGEWVVHPVNAQVDVLRDSGPVPICQLLWPTDERSEKETEANARLIAAAGTAAHECAQMGYDPIEAVRALPELLRTVERIAALSSAGSNPRKLLSRAAASKEED